MSQQGETHKEVAMAAYQGNIGFVEMMQIMDKANASQMKRLDAIVAKNDWTAYKKLVKEVTGTKLV